MADELNYYVDLRADFARPESIDEPAGEELAAILADGLPAHGIAVQKNEAVDFAYYLDCTAGESTIELMVGAEVLGDVDDRWYVQPCAKRSFFGLQRVPESDFRLLLLAVDATLRGCKRISDVRWFPSFDTPEYLALMPHSTGPIRDADFYDQLHPLIRIYWRLNRVQSAIGSPTGCILFFLLVCTQFVIVPELAAVITTVLFFSAMALLTIVPLALSVLVGRAARRLADSDDRAR